MDNYILDTFAWIEYVNGTDAGKRTDDYIKSGNLFTPTVVIGELMSKLEREGTASKDVIIGFIITKTNTIVLNTEIALDAGKLHAKYKKDIPRISLPDAIIMATAKKFDATVITGDEHFRKFDNVIMIK